MEWGDCCEQLRRIESPVQMNAWMVCLLLHTEELYSCLYQRLVGATCLHGLPETSAERAKNLPP